MMWDIEQRDATVAGGGLLLLIRGAHRPPRALPVRPHHAPRGAPPLKPRRIHGRRSSSSSSSGAAPCGVWQAPGGAAESTEVLAESTEVNRAVPQPPPQGRSLHVIRRGPTVFPVSKQ